MIKKKIAVVTWNNKITMLSKGKTPLWHLVGPYYLARIGYLSLLNLDYCIYFIRPLGGGKNSGGRASYNLLKSPYARNAIRSKSRSMKQGILYTLTKGASLRILLRQLPKTGAINLPLHRYEYKFVAACLIGVNGEIIDIDSRCRDAE